MPSKPNLRTVTAEEQDLRARLDKAEESLREILSGESDALFVAGAGGAQLFAIKGTDQSYRTLIENMSEGALTLTSAGLILYANRRFAEMLGTSLEKVIGSEIHNWFTPESRQVLQTLLRKDASDRRREELTLAADDGTQVPVNLSVSHLKMEGMPDSFCMVAIDLTEQKRNEAILAAESLARAILEQAADAIVICDETGRVIRASKQAHAFCGNNPVGQHFEHVFPLRQPDGMAFGPISAIDTNPRQLIEARLERDGQGFDLLVSVGHLKGTRNELLGSVVTLTDITERKRSEEEITFKNTILQTQLETSLDAILVVGESGQIISYNQQFIDLWRLSPQLVSARLDAPVRQAVAGMAKDPEAFLARIQYLNEHRDNKSHEEASLRDGRTIDWYSAPVTGAEHKYYGRVWYFRDITERKNAEQKFKDLLESAPDAMVIVNHNAEMVLVNAQAVKLFGWRREAMLGQKVDILVPERIRGKHPGHERDFLAQPQARPMGAGLDLFGLRKDGSEFPVEIALSPLETSEGILVITAIRDLTDRKEAENKIRRLNRVYAVLSNINTLIVRTRDRQLLFDEACRITVEQGNFRLAWIGLVDANGLDVTPVARAGIDDEGYLDRIQLTAREDAPDRSELLARALREKTTAVCNDIDTDPQMARWREEALRRGYRSVVVFPLKFADKVSGVLVLYASEKGFFDTMEMKLLTELAGDISFGIDHIEKQERLDYLAYYDVLTGLANRSLFLERVAQLMRSARSGHKLAVFLMDLERFKNINDSLGRPAGDALLRQVAEWLTRNAGDANLVARLDADHYAVVLPEVTQDGDVGRMLDNMVAAFIEHTFRLNDAVFRINAKVGVALFPDDGVDAETLFRHAEAALKKAKASGERYLFYRQDMTEKAAGKLTLENQLRQALDNEEFVLHYQPKVSLATGKMTSAEALIRWNDPRTGLVPPGRFIPILEETGLIYEVGRWALHQAIKDYLRWRAAGLAAVRIAVNISPLQLRNRGFVDEIRRKISIDAHAAEGLELEITESLIMEDVKHNIASLEAIRAMGVTIAIDDFGTGFSSLSYLARLPVHTLKIDRSFVIDMTAGPQGLALVSTIINLAHSLKLKVVAEGVETEDQSRLLLLLNCDEMQGFLFSKPVPVEIFESRFLAPVSSSADA